MHSISTRYGQQAELKEQNQHLMAANEELQKNLTGTRVGFLSPATSVVQNLSIFMPMLCISLQQRVAELEQQLSDTEKQNADVQKSLRECHVLLVAAKIDPGDRS